MNQGSAYLLVSQKSVIQRLFCRYQTGLQIIVLHGPRPIKNSELFVEQIIAGPVSAAVFAGMSNL